MPKAENHLLFFISTLHSGQRRREKIHWFGSFADVMDKILVHCTNKAEGQVSLFARNAMRVAKNFSITAGPRQVRSWRELKYFVTMDRNKSVGLD